MSYEELIPESNDKPWKLWGLAALISVAGGILFSRGLFGVIGVNPDLTELGSDIFLKYLLIVVALERSAAVYLGIYRDSDKKRIVKRIERVQKALAGREKQLPDGSTEIELNINFLKETYRKETRILKNLPDQTTIKPKELAVDDDGYPTTTETSKLVSYLEMVLQIYSFKLSDYENSTKRKATRIVFVAGIFIAFVGLSIFDDLLTLPKTIEGTQRGFYRLADILVTGGLLGGGSKSFAQLLAASDSLLEQVKSGKSAGSTT